MHTPFSGRTGTPSLRTIAGGLVLACVLLLADASPALGQEMRGGLRVGPAFGFLNDSALPFLSVGGDATANTNVRLDGHAGVYAIRPLADPYALQAELHYVRKGAHFSRRRNADYRVEQYVLGYLQGQVLGRRAISLPGPLHLHAVGGLTLERLLHGAVHREVQTLPTVFRETVDLADRGLVRRWDVGALIGIGLSYPVGEAGRLGLDLRYNRGFRAVFTDAARSPSERPDAFDEPPPLTRTPPALRHDVITAGLTYTLPLRR